MRRLLKKQGFAPEVLVTDKLRSYGAAKSEIGLSARHDRGLRADNRAANLHQPTRRRERKMQRFKSPGSAQRFLSVHSALHNRFNVQRHLTSRRTLRVLRDEALRTWRAATAARARTRTSKLRGAKFSSRDSALVGLRPPGAAAKSQGLAFSNPAGIHSNSVRPCPNKRGHLACGVDGGEENLGELVVTRGDGPEMLELVEERSTRLRSP